MPSADDGGVRCCGVDDAGGAVGWGEPGGAARRAGRWDRQRGRRARRRDGGGWRLVGGEGVRADQRRCAGGGPAAAAAGGGGADGDCPGVGDGGATTGADVARSPKQSFTHEAPPKPPPPKPPPPRRPPLLAAEPPTPSMLLLPPIPSESAANAQLLDEGADPHRSPPCRPPPFDHRSPPPLVDHPDSLSRDCRPIALLYPPSNERLPIADIDPPPPPPPGTALRHTAPSDSSTAAIER